MITARTWLVLGVLAGACRAAVAPKPPELAAIPTSAPDFMARQRVTGEHAGREVRFDAVVQKRGDRLLVLVLTPYGSRALAIEHGPDATTVQPFVTIDLPFDETFILLDVQRVFFQGLPHAPYDDGWHRGRVGDEVVLERWHDGRLHERRFSCEACEPRGTVAISYQGGFVPGHAPGPVRLVDERVGYRLDIVTTQYAAL